MKIFVFKENVKNERRIAIVPESVKRLIAAGNKVFIEQGAGIFANASDAVYAEAGAEIFADRRLIDADVGTFVSINRPSDEVLKSFKRDPIVVSLLRPLDEPQRLRTFIDQNLTAFSLEMIPRTTKAQSMDVLSSMATIAGYKAVLFAADNLPKICPMLTTAAGTVPPAKFLIIGAGVAGLQAIATARRLGAMVEAFDIRAAAGEAVRSLGAKFLELGIDAEGEGGYAKQIGEVEMELVRQLIEKHAETADCIITTALVPGMKAPFLITKKAVEAMKQGSLIMDLAGQNGGNCELTKFGETIEHQGVRIFAPENLVSEVSVHASQLFSRNVTAFLNHISKNGELNLDFEDEIINGSCIVHQGEIRNERVRNLFEKAKAAAIA